VSFLIIGLVVCVNIIFLLYKFEKKRYVDGITDTVLLLIVGAVFSNSEGALIIGSIASMFISMYLYVKPPKLPEVPLSNLVEPPDTTELIARIKANLHRRYV